MKQARLQSGSMVLSCVFFTGIFMLIMLMQWRSQEALQSVTISRSDCLKKQYAVEALLQYGIDVCKKQYLPLAEMIAKQGVPLLLTFNRWPLGNDRYMQGILEISYDKTFTMTATLAIEEKKQISVSCCLEKQTIELKDIYTITAWKKNEIPHEV